MYFKTCATTEQLSFYDADGSFLLLFTPDFGSILHPSFYLVSITTKQHFTKRLRLHTMV